MKISPKFREIDPKLVKSTMPRGALGYSISLKVKWAIFLPRSSKVSVQTVLLCSFHCKARPSGVSLEFPGLENIPPVLGNRAEFGQNHDERRAVSATLWVLKWSDAIFQPRRSKGSVQNVLLRHFQCKLNSDGLGLHWKWQSKTVWTFTFELPARKWTFKEFGCVHFTENQGHQELV